MRSKQNEAISFLKTNLSRGPIGSSRLQQLAKAAGIGWRTINAVKEAAGAASRQNAKGWEFFLADQDASAQDANAVITANAQTANVDSVLYANPRTASPQTANPAHVVDPDHAGKSSKAGATRAHPLHQPRKSGKRPSREYLKALKSCVDRQIEWLIQAIETGFLTEAKLRMALPVMHEADRLYNEWLSKFEDISRLPWDVRIRLEEDMRIEAIHQAVEARPAFKSDSDYEEVKLCGFLPWKEVLWDIRERAKSMGNPPAETPDLDDYSDERHPVSDPAPESAVHLYQLVADHRESADRLVLTPDGQGMLWQVFYDRAGVVLNAAPEHVVFFDPSQITNGTRNFVSRSRALG